LTLGNVFCGYLCLDLALRQEFYWAAGILFLGGVLDGLDGRVARLTGATSPFGEQLDSLADVISFGLAPSFLAYRWCLSDFDRIGLGVSFLFVVCGACRLARFNVMVHVVDKRHFIGLPIPAAAGALVGLIWVHPQKILDIRFEVAFLVWSLLLSYLMVSTLRYRSFKELDLKSKKSPLLVPAIGLVVAAIFYRPQITLTALLVIYAASAPIARLITAVGGLFSRKDKPEPRTA
jgi:CDP-diacylglycerol--serine O-phosphatidyltransferase